MKKYQRTLEKLLKEDYTMITKLSLLYEINCRFNYKCDDELLNRIYQEYLSNKQCNGVSEFMDVITNWCEKHDTDFELIKDYNKMFEQINK